MRIIDIILSCDKRLLLCKNIILLLFCFLQNGNVQCFELQCGILDCIYLYILFGECCFICVCKGFYILKKRLIVFLIIYNKCKIMLNSLIVLFLFINIEGIIRYYMFIFFFQFVIIIGGFMKMEVSLILMFVLDVFVVMVMYSVVKRFVQSLVVLI